MNRYISDLHFGHANVIRFDGRPFADTKQMEEVLIDNWNGVVTEKDTTFILGDFCWGTEPEWKRIVPQLNGDKVLIRGNHDLKSMSSGLKKMFQDIKEYKEITDNGKHVIMCHYPINPLIIQTVICSAVMSIPHGKMTFSISGGKS